MRGSKANHRGKKFGGVIDKFGNLIDKGTSLTDSVKDLTDGFTKPTIETQVGIDKPTKNLIIGVVAFAGLAFLTFIFKAFK